MHNECSPFHCCFLSHLDLYPLLAAYTSTPTSTQPTVVTNTTNLTSQDALDQCAASPDCYISYNWNTNLWYAFLYHIFGLLWTNQFIVAFSSTVVAGAVGSYYWTRCERDARECGNCAHLLQYRSVAE